MEFEPYCYKKDYKKEPAQGPFWNNALPLILIFFGSLIISSQVVLPYFSFPAQDTFMARPVKTFQVLGSSQDIRQRENRVAEQDLQTAVPATFYLSIPKLDIEKAVVKKNTTEEDPRKFLGHLLGTALPGDRGGAIFIYGHSTFPWLFDAANYRTIFSNLPKMEPGDQIYIEYPGKKWVYKVDGFKTLSPEEVNPYDSGGSDRGAARLVLMTCVPPGTRLRRMLVYATLVEELNL